MKVPIKQGRRQRAFSFWRKTKEYEGGALVKEHGGDSSESWGFTAGDDIGWLCANCFKLSRNDALSEPSLTLANACVNREAGSVDSLGKLCWGCAVTVFRIMEVGLLKSSKGIWEIWALGAFWGLITLNSAGFIVKATTEGLEIVDGSCWSRDVTATNLEVTDSLSCSWLCSSRLDLSGPWLHSGSP